MRGFFRVARAEEIQGARPRVPEPVPRLPDLPGLPRHAAAARGARRARRRPHHRPRLRAHRARGAGRSSASWRWRRRTPRSPTRCCARSRAGCSSCATSASTTSRSIGCRRRCRAASRSASTWRRRSARRSSDTLYVLDEPSIGLHPRDNLRLIAILRQLRDQGNTVIVVEHDADMIRRRRLHRRPGPRRGRAGRARRLRRHARRPDARSALADGEVPARRTRDPGAADAAPRPGAAAAHHRAPASTT